MITDKYGREYEEPEDFTLETRNDFTIDELKEALESEEPIMVYYLREKNENPGYTGEGKSKVFIPYYSDKILGARLIEVEEFDYEGGTLQGFGTFRMIDNGNLGDGHEAWALFQHEESGRLFRLGGWYSSWDGGEMDQWDEVVPANVTVVRYRSKDKPDAEPYDYPAVTVKNV